MNSFAVPRRYGGVALAVSLAAIVLLTLLPMGHPGLGPTSGAPRALPIAASPTGSGATASAELERAATSLAPVTMANGTGTPAWMNLSGSTGTHPPYRDYGRSMAYDPVDGYVLLFGGYTTTGYLSDTWAFHAGAWTELTPKTSPSARDHATLAWDPVDQYLLLFGGSGNAGPDGDTWTFVGGNWTQLTESTHPSARWASSLTWDAADSELILFGGCAGSAVGDTWAFAAGAWTQLHPKTAPTARENTALSFDPEIGRVLLFGGDDYYSNYDGDTWTFLDGNWTHEHPATAPSARTEASVAYDPGLSGVVVFGGTGLSGVDGDTWVYAEGNWTWLQSPNHPQGRYFGLMADDPSSQELILFGGAGGANFVDTWALYVLNVTAIATAGQGTAPLHEQLTATVTPAPLPATYLWNLGDGNLSSNATVNETFTEPGWYFPSVEAVGPNGSTASVALAIDVAWPFDVHASVGPLTGVAPLVVQASAFASGGTPPYRVAWSSGSGNTSASDAPTFTYDVAGSYLTSVLVEDGAGRSFNESFPVLVTAPAPPPSLVVSVVASATHGPAPWPVQLAAQPAGGVPPYIESWSLGDGNSSTGPSVDYTYDRSGSYTTELTVTDAAGSRATSTVDVVVTPALWLTVVPPPAVLLPNSANLSASVGGGVAPYLSVWDFGDNSGGSQLNMSHLYPSAGNFTATLRVSDALGRQVSAQVSVTVTAAPASGGGNPPATTSGASASSVPATALVVGFFGLGAVIGAVVVGLLRRRTPRA